MLQLHNLSIGYKTNVIATGLNATLKPGQLVCLVGRNGMGKSTLLRTLTAMQPPLDGEVTVNGKDVATLSAREKATTVSIVLTKRPEVALMTVEETVALGRTPYTNLWGKLREEDKAVVRQCLEATGTYALRRRKLQTLSDGECQKVMMARAMAQQTPIIVMDEPTAFLDYPSKIDALNIMQRLAHEENRLIIVSTHDLEAAMKMADSIWILDNGALHSGTPDELNSNGMLQKCLNYQLVTP